MSHSKCVYFIVSQKCFFEIKAQVHVLLKPQWSDRTGRAEGSRVQRWTSAWGGNLRPLKWAACDLSVQLCDFKRLVNVAKHTYRKACWDCTLVLSRRMGRLKPPLPNQIYFVDCLEIWGHYDYSPRQSNVSFTAYGSTELLNDIWLTWQVNSALSKLLKLKTIIKRKNITICCNYML